MMERDIRQTLTKLERLSQVIPKDDPRTKRAIVDYEEIQSKFSTVIFTEDETAAETLTEE